MWLDTTDGLMQRVLTGDAPHPGPSSAVFMAGAGAGGCSPRPLESDLMDT
jgi:hypothetical protein